MTSRRKDLIHPLLQIDTILDSSAGAQWLSILDLKAGRENSAFRLDSGLWQFTVTPFGQGNVPATLERLLEQAMHGVIGKGVLIVDDIIV